MSSNYPQLKIAARASLKTATSIMLILAFVLPTVFSALLPREARAATTISKSLSRPVNNLGLVGWWTMDGPDTLTNIADKSGQGNTGRLLHGGSGTTTAPGRVGQALSFDGINDYVTMGASYNGVQSVAFWIRVSTSTTLQKILDLNGTATVTIDSGTLNGNNFTSPTRYVDGVAASTINNTNWHHVVITTGTGINASALDIGRITATYLGGSLDDVRLYNRVLSVAEVLRLYQIGATSKIAKSLSGPDSLKSGLVGWWTMDGPDTLTNIADKSGQGNTGKLLHSGSGTTTTPGPIGQALNFDGVDDYVTMGDPASGIFDIGLQDWTASVWFKTTKSSVGQAYGMVSKSFYGGEVARWAIVQDGGNLEVLVANAIGTGVTATFSETSYLDNKWHLITMRVSRTGNMDLYVDGISKASTGISTLSALNWQSSYYLLLGAYNDDVAGQLPLEGTYFTGSLDDVRIYSRALSAAEIKQLYNIGATSKIAKTLPGRDSLTNGLVGWWTMDGPDTLTNIADKSGQGNTGRLLHGGSGTTTAPGPIGQALNFDGTNDYVDAGSGSTLDNLGPLTYSAWINPSNLGTSVVLSGAIIVSKRSRAFGLSDVKDPTFPITLRIFISGASVNADSYCDTIGIKLNTWQHVAVSWNGVLPFTGTFYVNGVACTTNPSNPGSGAVTTDDTRIQYIGSDFSRSDGYFGGKIDDVRIYSRALSASEVLQLYNMGR